MPARRVGACQKKRYGLMVVPRIATTMPRKAWSSATWGITAASSVCSGAGWITTTVIT
jgi:hypothetical protein